MKTKPAFCFLITTLFMSFVVSMASAETIWSIGTEDQSNAEFALFGDYARYSRTFADDVLFTIGKSAALQDWCGIQPGPQDAWAGNREHPYIVQFQMDKVPQGWFMLRIALVSTHAGEPGTLVANINGLPAELKLPHGTGDWALTDPSRGKPYRFDLYIPRETIRKGKNELTLTATGAWLIWDSLSLDCGENGPMTVVDPDSFELILAPLFVEHDSRLYQKARFTMTQVSPFEGLTARITVDGQEAEKAISGTTLGTFTEDMDIPEIKSPAALQFEILKEGKTLFSRTVNVKPQKKWTIHVVPQAHVDIGYTDLQEKAMEVHRKSNDLAVELVEKNPEFVWSVESSYVLEDWLKTRPQKLIEHFFELSRKDRLEIGAIYGNLLTGLLSDEESFRSLYFSKKLSDQYGSAFRSATLTDAPSHIWSIPTVLSKSGVKYLSMGINQTRAPLLRGGLKERSPIWWEGPDGSKILAFFHDHYAEAGRIGLTHAWPGQYDTVAGLQAAETLIPAMLKRYEQEGYPYDSIHIHGAYGDNRPLTRDLPQNVRAWNKKYTYPKIVFSTNYEWFSAIEKKYGNQLNTVRGDGGPFWEDGAASSALETAINRQSQQQALLAEMLLTGLHAQGKIKKDYRQAFMDIWHNIMLYDEHTWGAHNSISQPELPEVKEQFRYKAQFATCAAKQLKPLLQEARKHIASGSAQNLKSPELKNDKLTSRYYEISFDRERGAIGSIIDRETGKELLDKNAAYGLGQVLYAQGEEPPYTITTAHLRNLHQIPAGVELWLEHPYMPQIKMNLQIDSERKGISLYYDIEKVLTLQKEGVYIAFPFAGQKPSVDYAVANAVVRAGRDWLPGACKDWFTVQNWLRVRNPGQDALWISYDAPLINLQDVNSNKWLNELPIENGHVYAYIMNNYWFTNYKAGQGGRFQFRFAITSGETISNADAFHFGLDWTSAERKAIHGMVGVQPSNVVVSGFKRAEDGQGYIVRLREMSGEPAQAILSVPALKTVTSAHLTNGVEDNQQSLSIQNDRVPVSLKGWDIATVRVE